MKWKLILCTVLCGLLSSQILSGQTFKSLFVNDNSVFAYNTDTVINALDATGYPYDIFSARDSLRSPSFDEMASYDLLIWYCSTDGVGNYLWNGNDSDNTGLMAYLENGGSLWLMGNDFLYDRYSAPHSFAEGDFVYDYLGTSEYHAQSYGDDGGTGVPELILQEPSIASLSLIQWIFPTAWWVDACEPVPTAISIYTMGPDNYPLAGYSSAISFAANGHLAVSFYFDPALIDTYNHRVQLFTDLLNYFHLFSGTEERQNLNSELQVFPNPASKYCRILYPQNFHPETSKISIINSAGQELACPSHYADGFIQLDTRQLYAGFYLLRIQSENRVLTGRLIIR